MQTVLAGTLLHGDVQGARHVVELDADAHDIDHARSG
jgi:hypothetical protein